MYPHTVPDPTKAADFSANYNPDPVPNPPQATAADPTPSYYENNNSTLPPVQTPSNPGPEVQWEQSGGGQGYMGGASTADDRFNAGYGGMGYGGGADEKGYGGGGGMMGGAGMYGDDNKF